MPSCLGHSSTTLESYKKSLRRFQFGPLCCEHLLDPVAMDYLMIIMFSMDTSRSHDKTISLHGVIAHGAKPVATSFVFMAQIHHVDVPTVFQIINHCLLGKND